MIRFKCRDCESCPCAWEDRSYEGECYDCGCTVYHDLYGDRLLCQLPDRIKQLIRDACDRRRDKAVARDADGMAEYFMATEKKDTAMLKALQSVLPNTNADYLTAMKLRSLYEDILDGKEIIKQTDAL